MNVMQEVPLYTSTGEFCGYYDEDYLRELFRKGEARLIRRAGELRRAVLNANATQRVRALSGSEHGSALKTTYTEELYSGSKCGRENRPVVVTGRMLTMKKYRPGVGFVKYGEMEGFRAFRFNPDRPKPALYPTLRAAKEAMAV